MWRLVGRAINRFLAARIIAAGIWFAVRYAAVAFLLLLLFVAVWLLGRWFGDWADGIGRLLGVAVPSVLVIGAVVVLAWATTARAIEPSGGGEVLVWPEEEREPEPDGPVEPVAGNVYELYGDDDREDEPA